MLAIEGTVTSDAMGDVCLSVRPVIDAWHGHW
jgi:hypothetical protein